jgi:four helix bundle protein
MAYKDFTNMSVWQKAFTLMSEVYKVTANFPNEEKFGMVADMRRSGNSVLHNIAEGYGRFEKKDKSRFYKISRGSSYELISQTLAAQDQSYINFQEQEFLRKLSIEIIEELDRIIKTVETRE